MSALPVQSALTTGRVAELVIAVLSCSRSHKKIRSTCSCWDWTTGIIILSQVREPFGPTFQSVYYFCSASLHHHNVVITGSSNGVTTHQPVRFPHSAEVFSEAEAPEFNEASSLAVGESQAVPIYCEAPITKKSCKS